MALFDFLPTADWRNEGWSLNGASTLFSALNNDNDALYIKAPASKGLAEVTFPVDTSSVPEGAVITSVSVHLRCNKTTSSNHSVTVQVLPSDDEARFTSRTIYPTTTITSHEVAAYVADALHNRWDVHRLNKIRCRIFSLAGIFDCIRVYKFWCKIHYRVRPTITVNEPTGVVYTPSPTLSWTYSQSDGDPLARTDYKIFTELQTQSASFNPDHTTPVYSDTVSGYATSTVLPTSLTSDKYVVYMRSWSSYNAKSTWASKSFEIHGPAPTPPGNDNGDVSEVPGVGTIALVPDSYQSAVFLTMRDSSNLLSVQQADAEVSSDPLGYTGTNCTVARETVTVFTPGRGSFKMTASSAATMSMTSTFVEVAESTPVTIRAQVRSALTTRTATLTATYYDVDFTSLGTLTANATDDAGTWKEITATGTTPVATAYATLQVQVTSPANAEVHYADHLGIMYGAGSAWSDGGHMSRNLLSAHQSSGNDLADGSAPAGTYTANNAATTYATATATGTGAHGTKTHRMTYAGTTPTLGFRAVGSSFTATSTSNDFTLNKPAGVVDGDLMIAFVTTTTPSTINVPSGWSLVNSTTAESNNGLYILKKDGLTADPASWAGTFVSNSTRRSAVVIAYSGAAAAASQFVDEKVRADPDGSQYHTTLSVNNTAANAWRIGAFCARDDAGGGTMTANINPPTIPGPVTFVGRGTKWSSSSSGTAYTINRPSGVASGDLMLAFVLSDGSPTINSASGWTLVRRTNQAESGWWGSNSVTLSVFKRTAGSSEPSSWSGTLSSSQRPVVTSTVAYRNAKDSTLQFIAEAGSTDNSGTDITTSTINNTSSKSLRVSVFGANFDSPGTWTSTETSERVDDSQTSDGKDISLSVYDSNTTVSTGNTSRVGYTTQSFYGAVSWIGLIAGLDTAPSGAPDETERRDVTTGAADPWTTLGIYDSNGTVATGPSSLTATFSGTTPTSVLSWIGVISPAAPVVVGEASVKLTSTVDISTMPSDVRALADNKVSVGGSFIGSASGVPYLTCEFYRANQLLSTATAEGSAFGTTTWAKSRAVFDLPTDCTRVKLVVAVRERAVSDTVSFARMGITLGSTTVWRDGTSRSEHPVWSYPEIQYADDDGTGYGDWEGLPGVALNPPEFDPSTGLVAFTDHTIVPLHNRKYRARTVSYGLAGDVYVSGWGPESEEVTLTAVEGNWWLKDIANPDNNLLLVVSAREPTAVKTVGTAAKFYPLGSKKAVVVGDGYKGDEFSITVQTKTSAEFSKLMEAVKSNKTFLLQSDVDHAWWVRPTGDVDTDIQVTGQRQEKPLRFIKFDYVEVDPEV